MPLKSTPNSKRRNAAAAVFCAAFAAAALAPVPASAQEDSSLPIERRILDRIMSGIGFQRPGTGPNINYSERSPLVIPPSRDLPPPEANTATRNPAWPDDPDVRRSREAAQQVWRTPSAGFGGLAEEDARVLSRSELDRGRIARTNRPAPEGADGADKASNRPLWPWDLGYKGDLFNWKNMFGAKQQEESAKFTGEPSRSTLTQPPTGYQTPSPNHPYGVGPAKQDRTVVMEDRATRGTR